MSLNLYWEIPYTEVTVECIPRLKCVDGKWEPDYTWMKFKEIKRENKIERSPNKAFMSQREVAAELEEKFQPMLEQMEKDEKALQSQEAICEECKGHLWKYQWPVMNPSCTSQKNKLASLEISIAELTKEKVSRKVALEQWISTGRPQQKSRVKRDLELVAAALDKYQDAYDLELTREKNHRLSGKIAEADAALERAKVLQSTLDRLKGEKKHLEKQQNNLEKGTQEQLMRAWLTFVEKDLEYQNMQRKQLLEEIRECERK